MLKSHKTICLSLITYTLSIIAFNQGEAQASGKCLLRKKPRVSEQDPNQVTNNEIILKEVMVEAQDSKTQQSNTLDNLPEEFEELEYKIICMLPLKDFLTFSAINKKTRKKIMKYLRELCKRPPDNFDCEHLAIDITNQHLRILAQLKEAKAEYKELSDREITSCPVWLTKLLTGMSVLTTAGLCVTALSSPFIFMGLILGDPLAFNSTLPLNNTLLNNTLLFNNSDTSLSNLSNDPYYISAWVVFGVGSFGPVLPMVFTGWSAFVVSDLWFRRGRWQNLQALIKKLEQDQKNCEFYLPYYKPVEAVNPNSDPQP